MLISFFRTIKYAILDFWRNFWLSFITVTMITFALISVNLLLLLNVVSTSAISAVEDRVDVSVFLKPDANENQIYEVQSTLLGLPQVKSADLISREDALALFKEVHADDSIILQSLEELDDNPLGSTMVVKAKSTKDFPAIIEVLENPKFAELIQEKNFSEHREIIDRISFINYQVQRFGLWISIIFSLIAITVLFNTIRVSIYTHKDEIKIMKLVGASNWFVKTPFVIQGILFSLFSCALAVGLLYPTLNFLQPHLDDLLQTSSPDLITYFNTNFWQIFGVEFAVATALTVFSSLYAIRKYLRV